MTIPHGSEANLRARRSQAGTHPRQLTVPKRLASGNTQKVRAPQLAQQHADPTGQTAGQCLPLWSARLMRSADSREARGAECTGKDAFIVSRWRAAPPRLRWRCRGCAGWRPMSARGGLGEQSEGELGAGLCRPCNDQAGQC